MGNDPALWKQLEFSYHSDLSFVNMVKTVSQRSDCMRSITLRNFRSSQQMERMLWHVGNHCRKLRQVNQSSRSCFSLIVNNYCAKIALFALSH